MATLDRPSNSKKGTPEEGNVYMNQPEMAVTLISDLIRNTSDETNVACQVNRMKDMVNDIFKMFSDERIPINVDYYRRFMRLCDKLAEQNKIRVIKDKTIVSFGGRFSSGKSSFINAFTGMAGLLPVNQTPTTSIPTYIVGGETEQYTVHSNRAYTTDLPKEAIEALSHDFVKKHNIQLASFVESIVITTPKWKLPPQIALLDTPGYNKAETGNDTRDLLFDKSRAREQLKKTDYLIWLAELKNGCLSEDDFTFINNLNLENPILFVFNKADVPDDETRREVLENARQDIECFATNFKCFGITAYSSFEKKEYDGETFIAQFFAEIAESGIHSNDLFQNIKDLEREISQYLSDVEKEYQESVKTQTTKIRTCKDIRQFLANPLVTVWSEDSKRYDSLKKTKSIFQEKVKELNQFIESVFTPTKQLKC